MRIIHLESLESSARYLDLSSFVDLFFGFFWISIFHMFVAILHVVFLLYCVFVLSLSLSLALFYLVFTFSVGPGSFLVFVMIDSLNARYAHKFFSSISGSCALIFVPRFFEFCNESKIQLPFADTLR